MPFFGGSGDYHIVGTNVKGGVDAAPAVIGDNNIALGNAALQNIVNADGNVAIGNDAGPTLVDGAYNVFIGYQAGSNIPTDSSLNILVGHWAGVTDPSSTAAELQNSIFLGAEAGYSPGGIDELKNQCVGIGVGALRFGAASGFDCSGTVAIGYQAGLTNLADVSNSIYIGQGVAPTGPNEIIIGGASHSAITIGGIDFSGGPGFSLPYSGSAGTLVADTKTFANSVTWNNAAVTFTGWQLNVTDTASNSASQLADFQVSGSSKLSIRKDGQLLLTNVSGKTSAEIAVNDVGSALSFNTQNIAGRTSHYFDYNGIINCVSTVAAFIGFSSSTTEATNSNSDTKFYRDSAGIFAQRNDTNAQTFRLYNTYTDASNYERASFTWSGNICYLKPEAAGTGVSRPLITVHGSTTVAGLPAASAALKGARTFVSDSNAAYSAGNINTIVAAGGANFVPVFCDGTNWRIG